MGFDQESPYAGSKQHRDHLMVAQFASLVQRSPLVVIRARGHVGTVLNHRLHDAVSLLPRRDEQGVATPGVDRLSVGTRLKENARLLCLTAHCCPHQRRVVILALH